MDEFDDPYDPPSNEAAQEIAEMFKSNLDQFDDFDEMSDDAGMMWIQDANEICKNHGIERQWRTGVILDGIRYAQEQKIEEGLTEIRFQLELMYSL